MLYYTLITIYVIVCLLMMVVILLQQGRGDVASAFGGAGTQTAFGARQGATVLTKATTVLGALFMIGALVLAIVGQRGPGSVVSGVGEPKPAQQSAPAKPGAKPPASGQQGQSSQEQPKPSSEAEQESQAGTEPEKPQSKPPSQP